MNTTDLQQLKMAWLAARESGDTQEQLRLLREHPAQQDALVDFIAAYHATGGDETTTLIASMPETPLLALTQRATGRVLDRLFAEESASEFANLAELRKNRHMSKVDVARALRLGVDVWNKFEEGAIELVSLSHRQLDRMAQFFQVSTEQFSNLLSNSQPVFTINRRQTGEAAQQEQGPHKQSFAEAIQRSSMNSSDKQYWLE